ncbi:MULTISPECIES: hypothetical protein [Actinoalloteichus]|uniref:PE domain-containing protein n=1 Tax=Actinoalloteichus caeruleus DSM 43889 TaxID=1120930 RepID=A0ABT1JM24_ACTCY|nr:hypothetical protein [Actinoalloteichus caeruleus]MCP2333181.1 hypothetical protein [Actinoalloteichus caeruleus DSM 43889]
MPARVALALPPAFGGADGAGAFHVDLDGAPALRARLLDAVGELRAARVAAGELGGLRAPAADPVSRLAVDRLVNRAAGPHGSLAVALDEAIAALTDLVDQLDASVRDYQSRDDEVADAVRAAGEPRG